MNTLLGIDALFDKGLRLMIRLGADEVFKLGIDALFDKGLRLNLLRCFNDFHHRLGIDALFDKGLRLLD